MKKLSLIAKLFFDIVLNPQLFERFWILFSRINTFVQFITFISWIESFFLSFIRWMMSKILIRIYILLCKENQNACLSFWNILHQSYLPKLTDNIPQLINNSSLINILLSYFSMFRNIYLIPIVYLYLLIRIIILKWFVLLEVSNCDCLYLTVKQMIGCRHECRR